MFRFFFLSCVFLFLFVFLGVLLLLRACCRIFCPSFVVKKIVPWRRQVYGSSFMLVSRHRLAAVDAMVDPILVENTVGFGKSEKSQVELVSLNVQIYACLGIWVVITQRKKMFLSKEWASTNPYDPWDWNIYLHLPYL